MMAFNPAAAFNAQLLAASQPSTPVKAESSNSVAPTSHSDLANDAIRFLNASGPLLTPGIPGFPHPMNAEVAAFRAAVAQGAVPFPAMYSGMHPGEMKPEMMGAAAGAVPGFFFDASLGYHPYGGGLDGARRKNATRETTAPLKSWLNEHRKNPYPTKAEKIMLALLTKMTLTQVSTWFANARRRLKKENKMTWSPRNRPGEDDDDDLADIDASERDPCDRPSSSTSNISDIGGGGGASVKPEVSSSVSNGNNNEKETHRHHPHQYVPTTTTTTESNISDSPRKAKIWSIAETLSRDDMNSAESKKDSASSNASTSIDSGEYDSINIHASSTSSASSSTTTLPTTATSATTIPLTSSASSSSSSVASSLSGATMAANVLSTDGMPHQAPFLPQFNPWQQQMAFAMSRMPFPRPDILAAMAQAGQLRPPQMLFNPLLMGSTLTIPHSLASATVTPTSHMNSNGALMWCERRSTSPNSSSTHSATGGGGGGGGTMNNSSMEPTEHDKS